MFNKLGLKPKLGTATNANKQVKPTTTAVTAPAKRANNNWDADDDDDDDDNNNTTKSTGNSFPPATGFPPATTTTSSFLAKRQKLNDDPINNTTTTTMTTSIVDPNKIAEKVSLLNSMISNQKDTNTTSTLVQNADKNKNNKNNNDDDFFADLKMDIGDNTDGVEALYDPGVIDNQLHQQTNSFDPYTVYDDNGPIGIGGAAGAAEEEQNNNAAANSGESGVRAVTLSDFIRETAYSNSIKGLLYGGNNEKLTNITQSATTTTTTITTTQQNNQMSDDIEISTASVVTEQGNNNNNNNLVDSLFGNIDNLLATMEKNAINKSILDENSSNNNTNNDVDDDIIEDDQMNDNTKKTINNKTQNNNNNNNNKLKHLHHVVPKTFILDGAGNDDDDDDDDQITQIERQFQSQHIPGMPRGAKATLIGTDSAPPVIIGNLDGNVITANSKRPLQTTAEQQQQLFHTRKIVNTLECIKQLIPYLPLPEHKHNFYIPHRKTMNLTQDDIKLMRNQDNILIKPAIGLSPYNDICKPVITWDYCGLSNQILKMLYEKKYLKPFPVQQHVLPLIMSGYDVLCCAKTGSGKTLTFILPMLRYVLENKYNTNYHHYSYYWDLTLKKTNTTITFDDEEDNNNNNDGDENTTTTTKPSIENDGNTKKHLKKKTHLKTISYYNNDVLLKTAKGGGDENDNGNDDGNGESGNNGTNGNNDKKKQKEDGKIELYKNQHNPIATTITINQSVSPHALVLVPTRELAMQIEKEIKIITSQFYSHQTKKSNNNDNYHYGQQQRVINTLSCYGGQPLAYEIQQIQQYHNKITPSNFNNKAITKQLFLEQQQHNGNRKETIDILIATPGRLIELLGEKYGKILNLTNVGYFVIDEADRLMDLGFEPQLELILKSMPNNKIVIKKEVEIEINDDEDNGDNDKQKEEEKEKNNNDDDDDKKNTVVEVNNNNDNKNETTKTIINKDGMEETLIDDIDNHQSQQQQPQNKKKKIIIQQQYQQYRQTLFFSATFPYSIERLARKIMNNPIEIHINHNKVNNNIVQGFALHLPDIEPFGKDSEEYDKYERLRLQDINDPNARGYFHSFKKPFQENEKKEEQKKQTTMVKKNNGNDDDNEDTNNNNNIELVLTQNSKQFIPRVPLLKEHTIQGAQMKKPQFIPHLTKMNQLFKLLDYWYYNAIDIWYTQYYIQLFQSYPNVTITPIYAHANPTTLLQSNGGIGGGPRSGHHHHHHNHHPPHHNHHHHNQQHPPHHHHHNHHHHNQQQQYRQHIVVSYKAIYYDEIKNIKIDFSKEFLNLLSTLPRLRHRGKVIIFVDSKDEVDILATSLQKEGFACLPVHSGMPTEDRDENIRLFKESGCSQYWLQNFNQLNTITTTKTTIPSTTATVNQQQNNNNNNNNNNTNSILLNDNIIYDSLSMMIMGHHGNIQQVQEYLQFEYEKEQKLKQNNNNTIDNNNNIDLFHLDKRVQLLMDRFNNNTSSLDSNNNNQESAQQPPPSVSLPPGVPTVTSHDTYIRDIDAVMQYIKNINFENLILDNSNNNNENNNNNNDIENNPNYIKNLITSKTSLYYTLWDLEQYKIDYERYQQQQQQQQQQNINNKKNQNNNGNLIMNNDKCDILICTSILSRGIDVPSLSLVINYDLPSYYEDYIHRIGRTGRGGNYGYALSFIPYYSCIPKYIYSNQQSLTFNNNNNNNLSLTSGNNQNQNNNNQNQNNNQHHQHNNNNQHNEIMLTNNAIKLYNEMQTRVYDIVKRYVNENYNIEVKYYQQLKYILSNLNNNNNNNNNKTNTTITNNNNKQYPITLSQILYDDVVNDINETLNNNDNNTKQQDMMIDGDNNNNNTANNKNNKKKENTFQTINENILISSQYIPLPFAPILTSYTPLPRGLLYQFIIAKYQIKKNYIKYIKLKGYKSRGQGLDGQMVSKKQDLLLKYDPDSTQSSQGGKNKKRKNNKKNNNKKDDGEQEDNQDGGDDNNNGKKNNNNNTIEQTDDINNKQSSDDNNKEQQQQDDSNNNTNNTTNNNNGQQQNENDTNKSTTNKKSSTIDRLFALKKRVVIPPPPPPPPLPSSSVTTPQKLDQQQQQGNNNATTTTDSDQQQSSTTTIQKDNSMALVDTTKQQYSQYMTTYDNNRSRDQHRNITQTNGNLGSSSAAALQAIAKLTEIAEKTSNKFTSNIEINQYSNTIRSQLTRANALNEWMSRYNVTIEARGQVVEQWELGKTSKTPLHLAVIGRDITHQGNKPISPEEQKQNVTKCVAEIKQEFDKRKQMEGFTSHLMGRR